MRLNKYVKGAAVAIAAMSALAMGSGVASAAITTNYSAAIASATNATTIVMATQTNALVRQNQATAANNVGVGLTFDSTVVWPVGTTITLQINGATFNGAPNAVTATVGSANGTAAAGSLVIGAATQRNTTQYEWRVTAAGTIGDGVTFNLNAFQSSNLTNTNGAVTYTIVVNNPPAGGGNAIDATPVTSGIAFNVVSVVTGTLLANVNTIADVAQLVAGTPFVFNVAGAAGNVLGNIISNLTITNVTTAQPITAAGLVVKLTGNFAGIAAVNALGMTASSAAGVATAGAAANTMTINAAGTQATGIITIGLPAAGAGVYPFAPQLVFNGTTEQTPRIFTASADLLAVGTFNASPSVIPATASIVSITNNGLAFTTDLMGTASANTVVVRDRSGNLPVTGGKVIVSGTVYPTLAAGVSAGTAFGPFTMAVTLPQNGQVVLTPASIAADAGVIAGGGIPAGAAANFAFVVETAAGSVSEKKQVAGVGLSSQTILGGTLF